MAEPEFEQFGITKEQFDSIFTRKSKIRDYTFGIGSALGILAGCIYGLSMSKGIYETVLFLLFFGCFLGSIFGALTTIIAVNLHNLFMYMFSPTYRSCRQYRSAIKARPYEEV